MKTSTLNYSSQEQLNRFTRDNKIGNQKNVLIQVFTSNTNKIFIKQLINEILALVPNGQIIGSTTCGEISNDGSQTNSTIISFSIFNETTLKSILINKKDTSFTLGKDIASTFEYKDDLQLIITFTDGLNTNGEEYLNGISSVHEDIVISGGMAGDNGKFEETFVFNNNDITNSGAVAVAFYNKNLNVYTDYSFNWETVGKKHIIEKSDKNRVYKVDGMSAVDFYSYYLGDDVANLLPAIGIEFPLVINRNGVNVARAAIAKYEDGSLGFAGNIDEGTEVRFGHGDVQMIIDKGLDSIKSIINHPVESIFIYSCMARHALLKKDINLEILPLRELAPVSGFFTYGEFYHNCQNEKCSNQLLNQTMTIVGVSESTQKTEKVTPNIFSHNPTHIDKINLHRTQALSNLIERTTKELDELNKDLEKKVSQEIEKNSQKDSMLHMMQSQAQLGEMIEMIIHQWRQPLSAITSTISSAQMYRTMGMLDDEEIEKTFTSVLSFTEHLNNTIGDFREFFKSDIDTAVITLGELLRKAQTIIEPIVIKSSIKLSKEYLADENIKIDISVGLMLQVLLNIIKNAVDVLLDKAVKDPHIIIKTYVDDNNCVLEIQDNGGGIPNDILHKIFDKRFSTKGNKGTGIGLDMSKNIVESKLHGSLNAHNEDGWAIFTIKLPIV